MRLSFLSDLHLDDNQSVVLPGGDVLVLAGDVSSADCLGTVQTVINFFTKELPKYQHVIYVRGNHEYWGSDLHNTSNKILPFLPTNTQLLTIDNPITIDGVKFIGDTMWSSFNGNDPLTLNRAGMEIKDHKYITNNGAKLLPEDVYKLHTETAQSLSTQLQADPTKTVVVTHHAPSLRSIHPYYEDDYIGNGAYVSNLEDIMINNPHVTHWIHGHVHWAHDYVVGNTRVMSNPRGFVKYERIPGFMIDKCIDV